MGGKSEFIGNEEQRRKGVHPMTKISNHELKNISEWLGKLRFRTQFFGGVNEQDVWKKLEELNNMYETALNAERARYDALIEHYKLTGIEQDDREMDGDE